MIKISSLSHVSLCLLVTSCLPVFASNSIENALHEYELSAQSGNLDRYKQACIVLKEAAKKASTTDVELCLKTAIELKPQHNHGRRIAAFLCSAGVFSEINTLAQGFSHRGDTTPCTVTSALAGIEAGTTTAYSLVGVAGTIASICFNDNDGINVFGRVVVCNLPAAALQWASLYLNHKASKEKAAFDDAHQSLLRSLDATMYRHEKAATKSAQAPTGTAA